MSRGPRVEPTARATTTDSLSLRSSEGFNGQPPHMNETVVLESLYRLTEQTDPLPSFKDLAAISDVSLNLFMVKCLPRLHSAWKRAQAGDEDSQEEAIFDESRKHDFRFALLMLQAVRDIARRYHFPPLTSITKLIHKLSVELKSASICDSPVRSSSKLRTASSRAARQVCAPTVTPGTIISEG